MPEETFATCVNSKREVGKEYKAVIPQNSIYSLKSLCLFVIILMVRFVNRKGVEARKLPEV